VNYNAGVNLKYYGLKELGIILKELRGFKLVEKTTSVSSTSQQQVFL
jgi:hypothetical protein